MTEEDALAELENIRQTLSSDKNDRDSLESFYASLGKIVTAKPELADKAFALFNQALLSDKNDSNSLKKAYASLRKIVTAKPELADKAFALFNQALQSDKNDWRSLRKAYDTLGEIVTAKPELADKILPLVEQALSSDENNCDSLSEAYNTLSKIVTSKPELADKILPLVGQALQSDRNDRYSLKRAYNILDHIVQTKPELADKILPLVGQALQSDKNDSDSLVRAYGTLGEIVTAKPELADKAFALFNQALQSDKNDSDSLKKACDILGEIVTAKPELADKVLPLVEQALQSGKNGSDSLILIYDILGEIVTAKPELAEQAGNLIFKKINLDSCDSNVSACFCKICRNHQAKENLAGKYPQHEMMLEATSKLGRSTDEEIYFALDNMSFQQMAEEGKISVCQKCLNVLVGQMDKENGGDGSLGKNRKEFPTSKLYRDNTDWLIPSAYAAAEVFGAYLPNYLKKMASVGVSVHDAVYFLPFGLNKDDSSSLGVFLLNKAIYADTQGAKHARPSSELAVIAKNWSGLTQEERKQPYQKLLDTCKSKKYFGQKYDGFAIEAAGSGVDEADYPELEAFYAASLKVPCPFDVSKEFKFGNLTGRFLPRDDPRVGFFGDHTNCCQHFGGVGDACARSSMIDPYSQLFVIEKEDKEGNKIIVAGSWMWENEVADGNKTYKYACADNIEAIGDYKENPLVNKIYEDMADYLCQKCGYRKVTAGIGYQDAAIDKYDTTEAIPLPEVYGDRYTDAHSQVLLAENPQAPEVDTKQESLRFIRKATRGDFEAMQNVADKCFPDGDQALQIPEDDFNGFVLVDKYQGVQGYVLYDKQEKYIYDMAVMPDYRKDKNGSSMKLLGEMIKECQKLGGEWSCEARENTSLRFLKAMAGRGLCQLEVGNVDHVMDDGSKVYSVRFTPLNSKQNETTSNMARITAAKSADRV